MALRDSPVTPAVTSDHDASGYRSTLIPVNDQWLVVGAMLAGAVLVDTTITDLVRLPLTRADFIAATPDTWLPLAVVIVMMAGALALEWCGRSDTRERVAWLIAGAIGAAGAVWYFRAGDLDWYTTQDWVKEWSYHTAWRESLSRGQLPWHLHDTFQGTRLFFANAETNVAPHVLLLTWLDVATFVVAQATVLVAIGVAGSYALARELKLGPVASMAFLAIFLMNGHVIAHLETGHEQWVTFFLLPHVLLFLHCVAVGDVSGRTQAGLAVVLAMMALIGGWHVFVWAVIFIAVFVAGARARWRFGATVALLVLGLIAVRVVPVLGFYDSPPREFVGSFQRLDVLIAAFVGEPRNITDNLSWWEYNTFVGWVGLTIVLAGVTAPLNKVWKHPVSSLWLPSVVMVVLSTLNIYEWTLFRLPGFESERVASRLLIVGVIGLTLIACVQLNDWTARCARSPWRVMALSLAALLMAAQLVPHFNSRRPRSESKNVPPGVNVVSPQPPTPAYTWSVAGGGMVTLTSLGVAAAMFRRRRSRRTRVPENGRG
ncbi:MAG: hypothetical protein FJY55_15140, partial [Betaproteobacteria bacterium]|nr:hypothetical protein [Betaproteobacteria bacterium]